MSAKKVRRSNIELLRIFAALGVIMLHLNNANEGGGWLKAAPFSSCQFVMMFFEMLAIGAVNVFIIITGYFMAQKKQADLAKPLKLLLDMLIFAGLFYLGNFIASGGNYPASNLIRYLSPNNWFIFIYAALYVFSPFINKLWNSLSGKNRKVLLIWMSVLFSVYPVLVYVTRLKGITSVGLSGADQGYTIVNFVFMYLIGCAVRDAEYNAEQSSGITPAIFKKGVSAFFFVFITALLLGFSYLIAWVFKVQPFQTPMFHYNNPLVILQALFAFLMFRNLKLGENKIINFFSGAAFYVYILHFRFIEILNIRNIVIDDPLMLTVFMAAISLVIFILCFVCYIIYDLTFGKLFSLITAKWEKHRYIEVD
ncbi:MAG: acyltransferase [Ruminococcaceae bacterium]|nr:acyltransferase [Oscillospiraceae bacterium]